MSYSKFLVASVSVFALLSPAAAVAQVADDTGEGAFTDEVIVTARKRAERLIDVPIALTSFDGTALEDRGAANLGDFLEESPGIQLLDQGNGLQSVAIRGVTSLSGGNPNGYYLDELPFTGLTTPISPDVRAWDLERVEVLRGPQGTLFGEGSVGGTIRILTKNPEFNEFGARAMSFVSTTSDSDGENYGLKGAVNIPLVDDMLAVRLAGTTERYKGWLDNDAVNEADLNSQEFDTFRAKVRFDPVEDLTINGSYWLYDAFFPSGGSIGSDDGQVAQGTVFDNGVKNELFGLTGEYDFGDIGVFYGYANNNFDLPFTGTFGGGALSAVSDAKTDSHEVRLFSDNDSNLQWTVGLYQRTATRTDNTTIEAFAINSGSEARSRVRAVFGEGTYSFGDTGFEATAGIRYFEEDRTGNESASGVVTDLPDAKFDNWNPRFSLAWAPNDDVNFYISAANGYRSGQLQAGSSAQIAQLLGIDLPDATEPDSIWSYEAGVKANLMDQKVTLEAAIFNSRWKDVASLQPLGATGLSGLVNTDGTETTGIEAAVTARPTEGLTLFVSGSYTDPEYTAAVAGTGIDAGDIVDGTSRFTANASIDYRRPLTDTMDGFGRIGWQHRSAQHPAFVPTNVPGDVIDIIDARLGVEFDKFRLALFADNLFNEDGAASYRTVTPLESTALRVRPRTIGVELSVNIGN